MKFGDVVMCVASIAVVFALIFAPLDIVFVSALGLKLGYGVSNIVTLFLSALIGGYIFAGKIWEARREAITKIAVLWGALMEVFALIVPASLAHWGLWIEESYKGEYGATLSTHEWKNLEMMVQDVPLEKPLFLKWLVSLVLSMFIFPSSHQRVFTCQLLVNYLRRQTPGKAPFFEMTRFSNPFQD